MLSAKKHDLVADGDDGLQREFGVGDCGDDIGDFRVAVDGLHGDSFGFLAGLKRALGGAFHEVGEVLPGRLSLGLHARSGLGGIHVRADGAGDW